MPASAASRPVIVFAAASMHTALDDIAKAWSGATGQNVSASYAASSALAKQIEQGAPADIFISADNDWMDWAAQRNLIRPDTRNILVGNALVLIAPKDSQRSYTFTTPAAALPLQGERLAVGNVQSVPAGKYAKAALTALALWDSAKDDLAEAADVRAALALVARGEAPLGIVYNSDAVAEPRVKIIATFPKTSHPAIVYPAAIVATSQSAEAKDFLAFLHSPEARRIFAREGFSPLD